MSTPGTEHEGAPGASARREFERRKANREQRTRSRHRRIGGLLVALQGTPAHEMAWARGAEGEVKVAAALSRRAPQALLLHDRRIPGTRANIDHIAVTAGGVWVIDTKRYKGQVRVVRSLCSKPRLTIAGRDNTPLVEGLAGQVRAVQDALRGESAPVQVHGALCFVDADLPLVGTLSIQGFPLLYPKALAKRLRASGSLSERGVDELGARLAGYFPAA